MTQARGDRHGRSWYEADYARIIEGLRAGRSDDEIARSLGRTTGAVQSRAKYLLSLPEDADAHAQRDESLATLRRIVTSDAPLNWRRHVRAWHERQGPPLLDENLDARLRHAWSTGAERLSQISAATGVRELELADRCIDLRLAADREEVVSHLGCTPGNALAKSVSPPKKATSAPPDAVWVLTVTSPDGIHHVSLHPSRQAAALALVDTETTPAAPPGSLPYRWTIAQRVMGGGDTGQTERGMHVRHLD